MAALGPMQASSGIATRKVEHTGKDGLQSKIVELSQEVTMNTNTRGDALEKQRRFEVLLEHQKRDVPDFETMADEVARNATSGLVQKQIDELKAAHAKDLEDLYDLNANEYKESVRMQYMAQDSTCQDPEVYEAERKAIADLFEAERRGLVSNWANRHEQLRLVYITQLLNLQTEKIHTAEEEDKEKLKVERTFPSSITDFDKKPEDFKYKIAVFLTSDENKRLMTMKQQGWTGEDVKDLCHLYKHDKMFESDIQGLLVKHRNSLLSTRNKGTSTKRKRISAADLW